MRTQLRKIYTQVWFLTVNQETRLIRETDNRDSDSTVCIMYVCLQTTLFIKIIILYYFFLYIQTILYTCIHVMYTNT